MNQRIADEDLWSLVDRGGSALDEHLRRHPEDAARVAELHGAIGMATKAGEASSIPAPERIGSYRIEREIGRGSGGVVYEAWQEDPSRRVALKLLRENDRADGTASARFRREADALGRLSHPHVATIFEAGRTVDGHPFLAMELVHGSTLSNHVRAHHASLRERVTLFRDICDAVSHAHRQGVIHRDLKPTNVLVDAERGVKVVDFGLARLRDTVGTNATRDGTVLGTLGYMSPEQACGEHARIDERTDVYSLGVVLYELITDSPPHDLRGKNALDAVRIICSTKPLAPRARVRNLDVDLETIVLKAMEKEPEQRYGSAAALAEDVGCWLAGRPILARRPSLTYRMRKLAARNRAAAAMLAALLFIALAAGYAATFHPRVLRMSGDWYKVGSPFDGLRWVGETPQVKLGERWFELLEIDGLRVPYVLGFCKQEADQWWRKRFSEDLLQTLNLMGNWPIFGVDLVVRDLETNVVEKHASLALNHNKRQAIMRDRNAWPFSPSATDPKLITFQGATWEPVSVDGISFDALPWAQREQLAVGNYDTYCAIAGRSPSSLMDLELRNPATGEVTRFEGVDRERPRTLATKR